MICDSKFVHYLIPIKKGVNPYLLLFIPLVGGVTLGLLIISGPKQKTQAYLSPQINQITDSSQVSSPASPAQKIETYLLSSQSLLVKAIETSKNQVSEEEVKAQNEKIILLINQSLETINQAIGQYPNDHRTWAQRAKIYQTVKSYLPEAEKIAISDWQRAIGLDPTNIDYCQSLARLYLGQDDLRAAIFYLGQATDADPTDPNLLKTLAEYQTKAGMLKQARNSYQKIFAVLIDQEQRAQIQKEIDSLDQLLAQVANQPQTVEEKPEEIPLPDSPPLLEAKNLAINKPIIAAPEEIDSVSQAGILETNAYSGKATLLAGETEIKICNDHLSPKTQVYLSAETDTQGQILFVKRKVPYNPESDQCSHFSAAIGKPLDSNLNFRWWIIE